jgi:hypothetical protein
LREGVLVRRWFAALAAAVGAAISVSSAWATRPTREYSPFNNESYPGVCAFTVERQILANNSYLTTFSDGTQRYTGTFKERIINETSGKYIDFNGSGPVILVYNADGTVTETDFGPQFERPPGQLLLTNGQFVWTYDSSFNVLSAEQISGTSRNVCTLLG